MPDGKRHRRKYGNVTKVTWYAFYRSVRFTARFGCAVSPTRGMFQAYHVRNLGVLQA
jgi:hypothetical protein